MLQRVETRPTSEDDPEDKAPALEVALTIVSFYRELGGIDDYELWSLASCRGQSTTKREREREIVNRV